MSVTETPTPAPQRPAPPGAGRAGWLVGRLFLRVTLGRRRTRWLALALLVPLGAAVWWRLAEGGDGLGFVVELCVNLLLQVMVLGLALYLGVAAVRDEVEDRTLTYLFCRPLGRWVVVGAKILAVAVWIAAGLVAALLVVYPIAVSAQGAAALLSGLDTLGVAAGALLLASLAYTSLFALFGVVLRRPMIPALLVAFGWEGLAANLPGGFPRASLMFYVKSLLGLGPEASGLLSMLLPTEAPASPATALAVLLGATLLFAGAAMIVGARREFRL